MPKHRAGSPARKLGLVAPVSIAAALIVLLLAAWLVSGRDSAPIPPSPAPEPLVVPPSLPTPEPPVGRADLLRDAEAVASIYAGDPIGSAAAATSLAKRRFVLRIPFGCRGPQSASSAAQAFYEYDAKTRTVRLVARPTTWGTTPLLLQTEPPDKIEAVEGFWLPRPWSQSEVCPRLLDVPVPAFPTAPTSQSLGLARLFTSEDSRAGRRQGRPYEHTVRLGPEDNSPFAMGYRLVLEGRFTNFPDGRVAHCWAESPDHRPICLYAVEFDRVAFEAGDTGRQLAEWRN